MRGTSLTSHAQDLAAFWKGKILWRCPMAGFSTLRVGGPAEAVLYADELQDLSRLLRWLKKNDVPWVVIGRGSNILVPDEGLAGVAIILGKGFSAIERINTEKNRVLLRAGAGCPLARLVRYCSRHGLAGLEFAVGIPGSVGGAITMNAGCWGGDIGSILHSLTFLDPDGNIHEEDRENLIFSYRKLQKEKDRVIVSGTFHFMRQDPQKVKDLCLDYKKRRRVQQPQGSASAGSFFKNPAGQAAGKLIEEAGLKGYRRGGAMVSAKHANFIINTGTATAHDIIELMREIQQKVHEMTGIMLEPEVHILKNGERH